MTEFKNFNLFNNVFFFQVEPTILMRIKDKGQYGNYGH